MTTTSIKISLLSLAWICLVLPLASAQTQAHNQHLLRNRKHTLVQTKAKAKPAAAKWLGSEAQALQQAQPAKAQSLRHKRRRRFNPTTERTSSQEAYLAPLATPPGSLPAKREK